MCTNVKCDAAKISHATANEKPRSHEYQNDKTTSATPTGVNHIYLRARNLIHSSLGIWGTRFIYYMRCDLNDQFTEQPSKK